jgi:hypothetical protein
MIITWFVGQHPLDEGFGLGTDVLPLFTFKNKSTFGDFLHNFLIRLSRKGWISKNIFINLRQPAEKDVEDDSARPDVAFLIVLAL